MSAMTRYTNKPTATTPLRICIQLTATPSAAAAASFVFLQARAAQRQTGDQDKEGNDSQYVDEVHLSRPPAAWSRGFAPQRFAQSARLAAPPAILEQGKYLCAKNAMAGGKNAVKRGRPMRLRGKPVAHAGLGQQVCRPCRIDLDLATQVAHVDANVMRIVNV